MVSERTCSIRLHIKSVLDHEDFLAVERDLEFHLKDIFAVLEPIEVLLGLVLLQAQVERRIIVFFLLFNFFL
jgi:hypothetical protein